MTSLHSDAPPGPGSGHRPFRHNGRSGAAPTPGRLRGPAYRPVFYGVHVDAGAPDDVATRARAALLLAPAGAVVSFHTAAALLGAVVPEDPHTHVTVPEADMRRKADGTRFHVCQSLTPWDVVQGVPVTSPEQTFIDLARSLGLVDLVVVGDGLVRNGYTTPQLLVTACRDSSLKGSVAARRAAAYVRVGAESAMESRQRMLIGLSGLPEPELQVPVLDGRGNVVYRLDAGYPGARLGIEYDGRQHAEDDEQWGHDLTRREDLDGLGWRILVNRAADVYRHPERTLQRLSGAMIARGIEVPRRLHPAWRRHFPGRGV